MVLNFVTLVSLPSLYLQPLSRADSGMVFAGSRAESPEPEQSVNTMISLILHSNVHLLFHSI